MFDIIIFLNPITSKLFVSAPQYWKDLAKYDLLKFMAPNIDKQAKNVILFIGDGMSPSTVNAARILNGQLQGKTGEETFLSWERFLHTGLSKVRELCACTITYFFPIADLILSVLNVAKFRLWSSAPHQMSRVLRSSRRTIDGWLSLSQFSLARKGRDFRFYRRNESKIIFLDYPVLSNSCNFNMSGRHNVVLRCIYVRTDDTYGLQSNVQPTNSARCTCSTCPGRDSNLSCVE